MLRAKRAPLYISLCLILCLIGMALFTILVQSPRQSSSLWAERAAVLYARSLYRGQSQAGRTQILGQARASMLEALQYDPYNAAHWIRLGVIDTYTANLESKKSPPSVDRGTLIDIIKRLKPDTAMRNGEYILPSTPLKPIAAPD